MRRVLRGIEDSKVETARLSVKLGPDTCGRRREGGWNLQCDRKKTSQEILCFDDQKLEIFTNYLKSFFPDQL